MDEAKVPSRRHNGSNCSLSFTASTNTSTVKEEGNKMKSEAKKFMEGLIGPMTLGRMIRAFRTTNDLTQAQLAKKLKVTVSYVSDLENDRKDVSLNQAKEIATKLGDPPALYVRIWLEQKTREAGLDFDEVLGVRPMASYKKASKKKVSC
jgi:transcriptional regulator with XRE-family HTH domain